MNIDFTQIINIRLTSYIKSLSSPIAIRRVAEGNSPKLPQPLNAFMQQKDMNPKWIVGLNNL